MPVFFSLSESGKNIKMLINLYCNSRTTWVLEGFCKSLDNFANFSLAWLPQTTVSFALPFCSYYTNPFFTAYLKDGFTGHKWKKNHNRGLDPKVFFIVCFLLLIIRDILSTNYRVTTVNYIFLRKFWPSYFIAKFAS
jgi:hypothetical protein